MSNFPINMHHQTASGYNKNSSAVTGYTTTKGVGILSNPIGSASGHIRPLTNRDEGNTFQTSFGLPRPLKHFRKGRVIPTHYQAESSALTNYNLNRYVMSSKGTAVGSGVGLIDAMMDRPGGFSIKQNTIEEQSITNDCKTCNGVGIVSSYQPNNTYMTENPNEDTTNRVLCCNEEKKAKRRVIYANTNLKKNYYTTTKQYLQNRCQTYDQRVFNFKTKYDDLIKAGILDSSLLVTEKAIREAKPGSPLAVLNTYFANCFPNGEIYQTTEVALISKLLCTLLDNGLITQAEYVEAVKLITFNSLFDYIVSLNNIAALNMMTAFINNPYWGVPLSGPSNPTGCKLVVYKPNNFQYATQGAVSSSTRMLKLNVTTITTNAARTKSAALLKNKAPHCNPVCSPLCTTISSNYAYEPVLKNVDALWWSATN